MNVAGPIDPAEGILPGRRLIRVDSDKALSLAERLANHFHRLAWRTPLHALRLRGRYPLKLLGVPSDPLPGDQEAGAAILEGCIEHRGELLKLEDLDFANLAVSATLERHLHGFGWLRDLASATTRANAAPIAEKITGHWLAVHGGNVTQSVWRPELCARRIMAWAAHAPMILSSNDLVYRSAVLNGLARQARHLDRSADKAPRGLGRVIAWSGVIAAGLLVPGGDVRRGVGEAGLMRALNEATSPDGGLTDRSPFSQVELVELLAQLREVYFVRRLEMPAPIADALLAAVRVLLGVVMGDSGLSSWQGCGPIRAKRIETAIQASGVRTRPLRQPEAWGYQSFTNGQTRMVLDAAPPPVASGVLGRCASTLAFELSDGPHRLIVNCGGPGGGAADFPPDLADALRSTAAHSTLILADTNSTATYADGSLGRGVNEVSVDRQEFEGGSRIEASHDGYVRRLGFVHSRLLVLARDGRELTGEDVLLPQGRRRRSQHLPLALRFHLAPEVEVSPTADGLAALLRIGGGALWQFRCRGGELTIEESLWVDETGWPRMTQQLVVIAEVPAGGTSISWSLRRAG